MGSGLRAPEGVDLELLEGAQQLGLELERHVADLVEKEKATSGELKLALAGGDARGDAALDAEELGLEELRRDGGAVDGDKGALPSRRRGVEGFGDVLFADPGLAGDEDRNVAAQQLPELAVDLGHGGRPPDHIARREVEVRRGLRTRPNLDVDRLGLGVQEHAEHGLEKGAGGPPVSEVAHENETPRRGRGRRRRRPGQRPLRHPLSR